MSDASVAEALRSSVRLVVVEAPGGCGKTHQGAEFARDAVASIGDGRLLILTHTNAACDVFAARTQGQSRRLEIRTIDGLISNIGAAYHKSFGLPADVGAWARRQPGGEGYDELARKTAILLAANPAIATCLAKRYPVIICDEHQDASADQHGIVMSLYEAGSNLRIFADPMQQIFNNRRQADIAAAEQRWTDLKNRACRFEELDHPHRWTKGQPALGAWILKARATLRDGGQIDLTAPLPPGLTVHYADNTARTQAGFSVTSAVSGPIYARSRASSILVLTSQNDTVTALRSFFARALPVWEGHVREGLASLVAHTKMHTGNPAEIARGTVRFMGAVATGFSPSAFGDRLVSEAETGCASNCRGKPQLIQSIARHMLDTPDHRGVARALHHLRQLAASEPSFGDVKIHHSREMAEAIQLGDYDDPDEAFAELARKRVYARPQVPARAISTIHKAKGLEFENVILLPCDSRNFSNSRGSRARLYVAISRASRSLMLVVSRNHASPLFKI